MRKTKVKFNLMDALILLAIAVVAVLLLYIFVWSEERSIDSFTGTEPSHATYVIEVSDVPEEFSDKVKVGEKVIDSSTKTSLGAVQALETQDYYVTTLNLHEGTQVLSRVEDRINLYITIEADALMDGYTYTVGGTELYVGRLLYLSFTDFVCSGYCIALDVEG